MSRLQRLLAASGELPPVPRRERWILGGFLVQLTGTAVLVAVVLERAWKDNLLGHVTAYTVRLVWREVLRSHPDILLLVLGCAVFLAGSVIMARPFVDHRATLFIAVPLAALAGLLALGVAAFICFLVIATLDAWWSEGGGGWNGPTARSRKREATSETQDGAKASA